MRENDDCLDWLRNLKQADSNKLASAIPKDGDDLSFFDELEPEKVSKLEPTAASKYWAVPHPTEFPERGIIASVPFDFVMERWWRRLREISAAYDGMNHGLRTGLATGKVDFGRDAGLLLDREKKAVRNWLRKHKPGPIPLQLTILGIGKDGLVVTKEYGELPLVDSNQVPANLQRASIYRFTSAKGDQWFRFGWRRQDVKRPQAKVKPELNEPEDKSKPV